MSHKYIKKWHRIDRR